jgi:hypothetical protein
MPTDTLLPGELQLLLREGEECIYLEGDVFVHATIHDISIAGGSIGAQIRPIPTSGFRFPSRDYEPWLISTRREDARATSAEFIGGYLAPWEIYFGRDLIGEVVSIMGDFHRHGWRWRGHVLRALLPTPQFVNHNPWNAIQGAAHKCPACLSDRCFVAKLPTYSRPWNPQMKGRLLLMSEAPQGQAVSGTCRATRIGGRQTISRPNS